MDYINGNTLYKCREFHKPYDKEQICILLLLLHMNGYANYDCNPTNIIIRQDGVPFMIDFGECYPRKEGLDAPLGNAFDENTTDDDIIDFYIGKLGDLTFDREFLHLFTFQTPIIYDNSA